MGRMSVVLLPLKLIPRQSRRCMGLLDSICNCEATIAVDSARQLVSTIAQGQKQGIKLIAPSADSQLNHNCH